MTSAPGAVCRWISRIPRFELTAITLALGARIAVALGSDIYFDEAYYWLWGPRPDIGYYDHPPLIAWILAIIPVRLASLSLGVATVVGVGMFARRVHGSETAGWRAAALWCAVPAGALAGTIATPDSPLHLFWLSWLSGPLTTTRGCGPASGAAPHSCPSTRRCSWQPCFRAAVRSDASRIDDRLGRRCGGRADVHAGRGLERRPRLGGIRVPASPGPWRRWRLELRLAVRRLTAASRWPRALPLALGWMVRGPRAEWMLRAATGVPLTFFGLAASRTRGETNWPGPAYLSACVGLAGGPPRWTRIAIIAGMAVILVGSGHLLVPLARPARDASLSNLQGWGSLRELRHLGPRVVFASTYRLASEVAYYSGLETHVPGRRRQQFAYWPEPVLAPGEGARWISERGEPPFGLRRRFEGIEGPRILRTAYVSRTVHEFKVWTLVKLRESDESDRTSHVLELGGDRPKGEST